MDACEFFFYPVSCLLYDVREQNQDTKLPMLTNATWTLSNFCKGKPQPIFEQVKPTLPALQHLVHSNDEDVLTYACWALSFLSDGTNDKIQVVIDACVCKRLVELLLHPSPSVLIPALRTIGNIVTGDDLQTQAVIEADLISPLISQLQTVEFDIKKKAAWAISNATSGGSNEQIMHLVTLNCIKPLCDLLICPDARIVTVCLEGLDNYLRVGKAEKGNTGGVNYFAQLIDEADGSKKIENLQTHDNTEIYEKAMRILEAYWQVFYENLPFHLLNLLSFSLGARVIFKCLQTLAESESNAEKMVVPGAGPDQYKFASPMTVTLSYDHRVIAGNELGVDVALTYNQLHQKVCQKWNYERIDGKVGGAEREIRIDRVDDIDEVLLDIIEAKQLYPGVVTYNALLRKECAEGDMGSALRFWPDQ
ncbi:hypothetical protein ACS0TY_000217 [Phlomoides rotata]